MKKDEVVKKLSAHREELRKKGVTSLALFGSVVRDQAKEGSDIDLLVEFGSPVGVFHLFRVQHRGGGPERSEGDYRQASACALADGGLPASGLH